ncbi:MAG: amino acid adenylation domain-containing protein [Clostridia bacterium]|nr:amino acid adenylation domain-containing protein [Clostridia bacterium]
MKRTVLEYLDLSAEKYAEKIAYADEKRSITFAQLRTEAEHAASALLGFGFSHQPIAVFLDKSVECIAAFLGVARSGNFYSPLDTHMPMPRIQRIMSTLMPAAVLTDREHAESVKEFAGDAEIIIYEDAQEQPVNCEKLAIVANQIVDTDVLYVLFTSGSTGNPKGVIISHRGAYDFIEWGAEAFQIDDSWVLGNQTPFYFSMSVFDIYQTLRNGSTMYIIPRSAFSFPVVLMQYLFDHKINCLYWVPSALSMISALGALNCPHLPELRNVLFGGESMPMKQLNKWIKEYPDVRYANLYGPTEITDSCTYYVVNRSFSDTERLPMGFACRNKDVFLLDDENHLITDDSIGEVCVRGSGLAYGYYNDPEKTAENFVQNPLNSAYAEMIYRTGDLAQRNEFGEFVYLSRKDFQIKHMGHRIELGEIETAVSSVDGVEATACLYDDKRQKIVAIYSGSIEEKDLQQALKSLVPEYMLPNKRIHMEKIPLNLNGKVDRQKLKELIK